MFIYLIILLITVLLLAVLATFIGAERFKMIQKSTGKIKSVKRGFSYTYLFFGSLVPLFRGHIGGFFLSLFLELFTFGIGRLIFCFRYNQSYIDYLVRSGYTILDITNIETSFNKEIVNKVKNEVNTNILNKEKNEVLSPISKIVNSIEEAYNLKAMGVYDDKSYTDKKNELIDKIKTIYITKTKDSVMINIFPLFEKGVLSQEEINEISKTIDDKISLKALSKEELINLYINADERLSEFIKVEIKERGLSQRYFDLYKEYTNKDTVFLYKLYTNNLSKTNVIKDILNDNEKNIEKKVINDILLIRNIDIKELNNINKKLNIESDELIERYLNNKTEITNEVKKNIETQKNIAREKRTKHINELNEFIINIKNKCFFAIKKHKKYIIGLLIICIISIIVVGVNSYIKSIPPKSEILINDLDININYLNGYVSSDSNLEKFQIASTNKSNDLCQFKIKAVFSNSKEEITGTFKMNYVKNEKNNWEFEEILDLDNFTYRPFTGIDEKYIKNSLVEVLNSIKINNNYYSITSDNIKEIELEEYNENLQLGTIETKLNIKIIIGINSINYNINVNYKYKNGKWVINTSELDSELNNEKNIVFETNSEIPQINIETIKNDLVKNGLKINFVTYNMNLEDIKAINIIEENTLGDINLNAKVMNINVDVENSMYTIKGTLAIEYEYKDNVWNLNNFDNLDLQIVFGDISKEQIASDLKNRKVYRYEKDKGYTIGDINMEDIEIIKIEKDENLQEIQVKIKIPATGNGIEPGWSFAEYYNQKLNYQYANGKWYLNSISSLDFTQKTGFW